MTLKLSSAVSLCEENSSSILEIEKKLEQEIMTRKTLEDEIYNKLNLLISDSENFKEYMKYFESKITIIENITTGAKIVWEKEKLAVQRMTEILSDKILKSFEDIQLEIASIKRNYFLLENQIATF